MKLRTNTIREPRPLSRDVINPTAPEADFDFDPLIEIPQDIWEFVDDVVEDRGGQNTRDPLWLVLLDPVRTEKMRSQAGLRSKFLEALEKRITTDAGRFTYLTWGHFFPHAQIFPELMQCMRQASKGKFEQEFSHMQSGLESSIKGWADPNQMIEARSMSLIFPEHKNEIQEWLENSTVLAWLLQNISRYADQANWGRVVRLGADAILSFPDQQAEIKSFIHPFLGKSIFLLRAEMKDRPSLAYADYFYDLHLLLAGEVGIDSQGQVFTRPAKKSLHPNQPLPERTHLQ